MRTIIYLSTVVALAAPAIAAQEGDIKRLESALKPSVEAKKVVPLSLSGHDMRSFGAVSGHNLKDCRMFDNANLSGAIFTGMQIDDIKFEGVNFDGADFSQCVLNNVRFVRCNMRGVNMKDTGGKSVTFESCNMKGANLSGIKLLYAGFTKSNLEEADLSNSDLDQSRFYLSQLTNMNLSNSSLYKVSFERIKDMTGMNTDGIKTVDTSGLPWFSSSKPHPSLG